MEQNEEIEENELALEHQREKEKRFNRRKAKENKKKKARKIRPWLPEGEAEKLADHLCNCSCDMCKNPRKSKFHKGKDKRTMQERRFWAEIEEIRKEKYPDEF